VIDDFSDDEDADWDSCWTIVGLEPEMDFVKYIEYVPPSRPKYRGLLQMSLRLFWRQLLLVSLARSQNQRRSSVLLIQFYFLNSCW